MILVNLYLTNPVSAELKLRPGDNGARMLGWPPGSLVISQPQHSATAKHDKTSSQPLSDTV
jgi:hypothetical protein